MNRLSRSLRDPSLIDDVSAYVPSCLSKSTLNSPGVKSARTAFFYFGCLSLKAEEQHHSFELANNCPAGFKLTEERRCELNSLYDNYRSPHDSGVGGPRAGLPKIRDGFSPQVIDLGRYLFSTPCFRQITALPARAAMIPIMASPTGWDGREELIRRCSTARRQFVEHWFSTRSSGMAASPRSKSN